MKRIRYIKDFLYWVLGCSIYAIAITALLTPNKISPGGFTGIATAVGELTGISAGWSLLALNIPLLIFALFKLGGGFTLKTVAVTFLLSFVLNVAEWIVPSYEVNPILAAVFGGILSGFGLALILLRGATTGGVDVVAMLVNNRFPHVTLGRFIMIFDFCVVVFAAFAYRNIESALYSVISIYASMAVRCCLLSRQRLQSFQKLWRIGLAEERLVLKPMAVSREKRSRCLCVRCENMRWQRCFY